MALHARHIHGVMVTLTLILILHPSESYGQLPASLGDTSAHSLPSHIVTPGRHRTLITSPTPMQMLNGAQLERLNGLSVADAMRYFSGVQLKDYGGIGGLKTINVRSMGSHHTAVFYDNIQLGNAQNGQVDLGKFSLDNMEEIALYNGDKNTLIQSAKSFASASGVYLQTKSPQFTGTKTMNAKLGLKTGSFGLVNPSLLLEHKIKNNLHATISSEINHAHGKYKFQYAKDAWDTTLYRKNGDLTAYRIEAGINKALTDSGFWKIKTYYYQSERGLPNAIVSNRYAAIQPDSGQHLYDRNFFAQASFNKRYGAYTLQVNAKYAHDYNRYINPEIIKADSLPLQNNYHQQELYLSIINSWKLRPRWTAALNADIQQNKLDADLYRFPYPTRYTLLAVAASQYQVPRLTMQASVLATQVMDKVKQYAGAGNKKEMSPAMSFSWQPFSSPDLRIRGFYKSIFRMPTFNDLYYTTIGSVFLKPERTQQFNTGIAASRECNGALQYISIQADVYYNTIKDKIVAVPSANPFIWSMRNISKVDIRGADLVLRTGIAVSTNISGSLGINYTYQQAKDITPTSTNRAYGNQLPYTPWHNGSLLADITIHKMQFNYSFIYTGERYSQAANIDANYIEPWYTHDLSVSRAFNTKKIRYRLSAEINNLFNQYYDVVLNFPMPGRNFRCSLTINY